MPKYTITRAITRTKTIRNQIVDLKNDNVKFITSLPREVMDKEHNNHSEYINFIRKSQSKMDTIKSLFDEYNALKKAIRKSNEVTFVEVNGEEITVAEAITMKEMVAYRKALLDKIIEENNLAKKEIAKQDINIDDKVESISLSIRDVMNGTPEEHIVNVINNEASRLDKLRLMKIAGFNVDEYIEKESEAIKKFEEEIDYVLSESNAINYVEIF